MENPLFKNTNESEARNGPSLHKYLSFWVHTELFTTVLPLMYVRKNTASLMGRN